MGKKFTYPAILKKVSQLSDTQLFGLAVILCIPAFLWNLSLDAFIGDEAIRSLVALEMKLTGNYLVPTLNGEPYYNKPPLYNWFILSTSSIFGYFGEWPTRMTSLIFLMLYAYTVYYFTRKHLDRLASITMSFMLLTSGRILFWDSMYGLIDICFSWVVYLNFMALYHYSQSQQWKAFFTVSYFLCSIAFLLKGIPALVFQVISIPMALYLSGELKKKIFSFQHILGLCLGLLPVMAYYIVYAYQVSLATVFHVLLDQSLQRTATHHGIIKTIIHIFTFPFEQIYHFLPWSLFIVLVFHPMFMAWVRANSFIRFNFLMLLANVPVYWSSVEVYPRYLLMFIPMFNVIGYYALIQSRAISEKYWKGFQYMGIALLLVITLLMFFSRFDPRADLLSGIDFIWMASLCVMVFIIAGMSIDKLRWLLWLSMGLLVLRSVFNVTILPMREMESRQSQCRQSCKENANKYFQSVWYIYDSTETHQVARFYTSTYTNQLIRKTTNLKEHNAIYLVDTKLYPNFGGTLLDSLLLENRENLKLFKIDE